MWRRGRGRLGTRGPRMDVKMLPGGPRGAGDPRGDTPDL